MCLQHEGDPSAKKKKSINRQGVQPPNWEEIPLPPDHVLSHLTDAHCHSTDLTHAPEVYDAVKLGGLASMATVVDDQDRTKALSSERGWCNSSHPEKGKGRDGKGVGVVACFGYHPWFTHLYTLSSPNSIPSKEDHYFSLFQPSSKHSDLLKSLIPYLPDPISFEPLLEKLRDDIRGSLNQGRLTMLGEVGLDGSARMRWPKKAKHLHPDYKDQHQHQDQNSGANVKSLVDDGKEGGHEQKEAEEEEEGEGEEEWKRLTPFKVPMSHQREILDEQMEIAIELGVNISFHSVSCAGPSLDALISMRDKHKMNFTNKINVDLHSAGGWSPEFWKQAEKNLLNLYASPSIFITSRSPSASSLIASISKERLLVESDSHDVRLSDRLVWSAAEWVSRCKGWKLEGRDTNPSDNDTSDGNIHTQNRVAEWTLCRGNDDSAEEEEEVDEHGDIVQKDVWTVRTLERNWARFMGLVDD
ncbi:uncharacterized protein IL334_006367 [Kwoniella shivajii]|uniref:TatD DNase n=1 Tax=Kwoniella shivajii TaxID=564305 RepID=A0ABZ1D5R9_9TREE|nr:hypothetical protein IL334_006367 [Kwoniella shivajii]